MEILDVVNHKVADYLRDDFEMLERVRNKSLAVVYIFKDRTVVALYRSLRLYTPYCYAFSSGLTFLINTIKSSDAELRLQKYEKQLTSLWAKQIMEEDPEILILAAGTRVTRSEIVRLVKRAFEPLLPRRSSDVTISLTESSQAVMKWCDAENSKVRKWCTDRGLHQEVHDIMGTKVPSGFFDYGSSRINAAVITPFDKIICSIILDTGETLYMHSFNQFLKKINELNPNKISTDPFIED